MVSGSSGVTRAPRPSSLADVLDLILDKGLVIDAYVRVSAVGIEVLTIDARIVIASVDTYLHYAEAVNRLDLRPTEMQGIPELVGGRDGSGDGDGDESEEEESGRRELSGRGEQSGRRQERRHQETNRNDDNDKRRGLAARLGERGRWDQ